MRLFPYIIQHYLLCNIIRNFMVHKKVNVAFGHDRNEGTTLHYKILEVYNGTL